MGLAKTTIMLGLYTAATNMRLLRAWARRTHDTEELTGFIVPVQVADVGAVDLTTGELERPPPDSSPATRQQHQPQQERERQPARNTSSTPADQPRAPPDTVGRGSSRGTATSDQIRDAGASRLRLSQ
jgi:hypothetical protein